MRRGTRPDVCAGRLVKCTVILVTVIFRIHLKRLETCIERSRRLKCSETNLPSEGENVLTNNPLFRIIFTLGAIQ